MQEMVKNGTLRYYLLCE